MNRKLDKNKRIQTSNWETDNLSKEQIVYAADDALAALHVYACIEKFQERRSVLSSITFSKYNLFASIHPVFIFCFTFTL